MSMMCRLLGVSRSDYFVATLFSATGVPNTSANACAARVVDRNCPHIQIKDDCGDPRPLSPPGPLPASEPGRR